MNLGLQKDRQGGFHAIPCQTQQRDLSRLSKWASNWKMWFNAGKVMHIGAKKPPRYKNMLRGSKLVETGQGKDLGVLAENQ